MSQLEKIIKFPLLSDYIVFYGAIKASLTTGEPVEEETRLPESLNTGGNGVAWAVYGATDSGTRI